MPLTPKGLECQVVEGSRSHSHFLPFLNQPAETRSSGLRRCCLEMAPAAWSLVLAYPPSLREVPFLRCSSLFPFARRLSASRGHDGFLIFAVVGTIGIDITVSHPSFLSLDFGTVADRNVRNEGHKLLGFLFHVQGFLPEKVVRVGIVLETVGPDEHQIVDKVLFRLVLLLLELLHHRANVHGMFDDVVVVRRFSLVDALEEGVCVFAGLELHEHLFDALIQLFLANTVLVGPLASILADFAYQIAQLGIGGIY